MARSVWLALAAALLPLPAAVAQPAPPPAATAPDPAFEAARAAFDALPERERKAVQDALVWTGDHSGVVSGSFGRRTFEALSAYQKRARLEATGVADERTRTGLQAAARRAREAAGFEIVADARTGARLGIPQKLFTRTGAGTGPGAGSRWQTADERATLDTRAYPPGAADLPGLFERLTAPTPNAPGRKVTYKLLRPDFLVVTGETERGKFYIRYAAGPAGLRGYTLGYDKTMPREFEPVVVAIANAFEAFPDAVPPAVDPAPPRVAVGPPAAGPAPVQAPATAGIATGLVVAPRRILTAAVEPCAAPRVGGRPARVLKRDAAGWMLLEAEGGSARPLATAPSGTTGDLLALAAGPGWGVVAVSGERTASGLSAPLQTGAAGAPVLDRSGRLVGLVKPMSSAPRLVAGVAIPQSHPIVAGEALAAALAEAGATGTSGEASPARSAGEIAAALGAAVVSVECGR